MGPAAASARSRPPSCRSRTTTLTTTAAVAAIQRLTDVEDVRTVVAYEQAHKARSSVVGAAQARVAAIAEQVAGV